MADGSIEVDGPEPVQRHVPPLALLALPVARRGPALGVDRGPAVGQPMRWRRIAAVGHELQPLAIGDEAVGQAMVLQQHLVARTLVVVEEGLRRVPHAADAAGQVEPPQRRFALRLVRCCARRWPPGGPR